MKNFTRSLLVLILAVVFTSCSTTSKVSNSENNKITENGKTYAINFSNDDNKKINSSDEKLIIKTFENEMKEKGYTKSDNPDIIVMLDIKTIEKKSIPNNTTRITNYNNGEATGTNRSVYRQLTAYNINPLNVNGRTHNWSLNAKFINIAENKMIWKGTSLEKNISTSTNRSYKQKSVIRDFVSRVFDSKTNS